MGVRTSVRTIRDDWFVNEVEDKKNFGWTDIYYGERGPDKDHGHRVEHNGVCEFHHTIDGQVLVDGVKRY